MQKIIFKNLVFLMLFFSLSSYGQEKPVYEKAAWTGESFVLENENIQIRFFKRIAGWGWGEIRAADGKLMGVMEHLGEIMLRDQDIPVRFVAQDYELKTTAEGQELKFSVQSLVVRDVLKKTSFDNWMRYPFTEPAIRGEVIFSLDKEDAYVKMKYQLEATGNYYARYIRGPWIKVGEASFGTEKTDAMLPGVEWAIKDEWTSGTDWFKDPWALRVAPHPNKVSIPLMALSHKGTGIGLSWNPNQVASRWFNYRSHVPQPVFAAPNFVDRMNNNLMGLMVPDATIEGHENEIYAEIPLELKIGQKINFDADLWLSEGNSMDVVLDWVKRNGLPEPSETRWDYDETLRRVANAYNTNLWHEGEGFGVIQGRLNWVRASAPDFLYRFVEENKKTELAKSLNEKIEWCEEQQKNKKESEDEKISRLKKQGDKLIESQGDEGQFYLDIENRDFGKDDFIVATSYIEPMGASEDTALEMVMQGAMRLLEIGRETEESKYLLAAKKSFDFSMHMMRPEAGDFWETPLHAANLLAAGNAAIGYYEAYREFGEEKYREKAIYWIRTIIPFTHVWETEEVEMLYNTKPVLSSSDWYFANWVRDHVQWEVLRVFAESGKRNIDWVEIDPETDWATFHKGITHAAMRWMNLHEDKTWKPHNLPVSEEKYNMGMYDYCYPDTHNSTTGNYGGMMILPAPIMENLYLVIDRENRK